MNADVESNMTQEEIRKAIDDLNRSIGECNESAIILSSTASNRNTASFFREEINAETFRKNGQEIGKLGQEFMTRCKCRIT